MTMLPLAHLSLFCLLLHVAAVDDGDDFANDLFTDLSPLLALFGERVTTQFMSQSIGLADCIILAMAPLGIVTIIISAIRVGGPALMKAIIGRAIENLSAAEIEIMSSTSKEVCELWNGKTIEVNGRAPIHLAVMAKQQGVLDLLARDVDARDSREQTPLHLTIGQDSTILTELLLRLGASVDAKDWINQTPLHLATTRGLNDAVKLLIQAKADVNAEDTERQKPLHNAVKWGDEGTVRLLIDAGAEVDVKGQFDQTPLHLAAERGYSDVVRLLIDEKVDVNARDWGEMVELLVNVGVDVNAVCEEHGHTAMHHVAKKGMADVASVMLAKDRKSLKIKDKSGNLPVHYLDSPASEVMFSMFVAAGGDKDATDSCGRTLIHRISRGGGSNATEFDMFLVRQGVRVDLRDKEGHTAEDYARRLPELKDLADCLREAMERNRDEQTRHEQGEGEESGHEQR
ncbi:hypothetical protein BHE90_001418 [Fusarium euwallaceae]|uniref:Uncharacterized protein n=1 Tax=Fusarium euwallaceae TaxID=1147111 RepID=A0A430M7X8_9HYPO|nr:hypothetical protein BHE90_001418 [Fusarium euwallaceae]